MKTFSLVPLLLLSGAAHGQYSHWSWEVLERLPATRTWADGINNYIESYGYGSPIITSSGDIAANSVHSLMYQPGFMDWRTLYSTWDVVRFDDGTRSLVSRTDGTYNHVLKLTPDGRALVTTTVVIDDLLSISSSAWWRRGVLIQAIPGHPIKGTTSQLTAGYEVRQHFDPIPKIWGADGQELPLPADAAFILDMNGIGDAIVVRQVVHQRTTGLWRQGIFTPLPTGAANVNNLGDVLCVNGGGQIQILSTSGDRDFVVPDWFVARSELNDNGSFALDTVDDLGSGHMLFNSCSEFYNVTSLVTDTSSLSNFRITDLNEFGHGVGVGTQNGEPVLLRFTPEYDVVPEPGSMIVLALGVGFVVRRRPS